MTKRLYHFIGIGGIGMSALARVLMQKGYAVQGSDSSRSSITDALTNEGARVSIGHSPEGLDHTVVVYTSAVNETNVEFAQAKKLGLPRLHRSDLLDQLMRSKCPLLVTGTHGKTTTSSLLASAILEANLDPSFVVGGIVQSLQTNGRNGKGKFFIAEADESDGSFLKTPSFGAIVTNCENDHLDYWRSPQNLDDGFRKFFSNVLHPEYLFWCKDDHRLGSLNPPGSSYGFSEDADWVVSNFRSHDNGIVFDLSSRVKKFRDIELSLFGVHNALNASAVFALCSALEIDESAVRKCFANFRGVKRRLEYKGEANQVRCYDDYGHHPTEVQATIQALKNRLKGGRLVVVFQPHRFSRTKNLWEEFFTCFDQADLLFLTDIYPAGEAPLEGITSENLYVELRKRLKAKAYFFPKSSLPIEVVKKIQPGDVILTMGAGDITKMGPLILESYQGRD